MLPLLKLQIAKPAPIDTTAPPSHWPIVFRISSSTSARAFWIADYEPQLGSLLFRTKRDNVDRASKRPGLPDEPHGPRGPCGRVGADQRSKTTSGETSHGEAVPRPARDHQAEPAKSFCSTKPSLQVNWPRVSWIVTATS